jgi:hypothetical protein
MGVPAVAMVIRRKEINLVEHFRDMGALSPDSAKSLRDLQVNVDDFALQRLHRRAVIRAVHDGEYYLDEEVWRAVRGRHRRVGTLIFLLVVLMVLGLIINYFNAGARGAPLT